MALNKSLGLTRLTVYGVGTIIGAGIYSVIAPATTEAGAGIWLSFVLAAVVAGFSALSYAELASALPNAGAEHNFLRQAFPEAPAFAFVIGIFIALHGAATLATVALTFGQYLQRFIAWPPTAVALAIMAVLTVVNIAGLKRASALNVVLTTLQILCLGALIVAAMSSGGFVESTRNLVAQPVDLQAVVSGTAVIFFIYTGFEHVASLTEEAERPERVWLAFVLALGITTVVYLSIIFATLSILSVRELGASELPLAEAAGRKFGVLGTVIAVAALLATSNAVLSASVSGSRLLFGMARSGDLPSALSRTLPGRESPWVAALVVLAMAAAMAAVGKIKLVASLSSFGAVVVFAAINLALIVLRYRKPELKRPFRVPSVGRFPYTAAAGVFVSIALATQYTLQVYMVFGAGVLAGLALYGFAVRGKKS